MKTRKQKIFGAIGLSLILTGLIGLFSIMDSGSGPLSTEAQQIAGYSTRVYRQAPVNTVTGISGTEALGYMFGFNGATWDRFRVQSKMTAVSLGAGTTETTIWDPAGGKKFRLMGLVLNASAGTLLTFKDGTAGSTIFTLTVPANVPIQITPDMFQNGYLSSAADNNLTVTRGTSAALDGFLIGQEN